MKKSLINSLATILVLSATAAMAQEKMKDMPEGQSAAGQVLYVAKGKVTKVDVATGVVTLAHEPVKNLNWPSMIMGFKVKDKTVLDKLVIGKTVNFEFSKANNGYVISNVK